MIDEEDLDIIAEGKRWVAINKPGGISVEKHFDHDTVEKRALAQFKRPGATKMPYVGIAHRLDRPVSGVLLLAQNKSTLVALNELFAERKMTKVYHALVSSPPPQREGRLKHFLLRDKFGRKAIAAHRPLPGSKEAILDYKLLDEQDGRYLLEVRPVTGKFHQIRVQLAQMECPIIGDSQYGSMMPFAENCIALHARSLAFTPPGERLEQVIVAEYPEVFRRYRL